MFNSYIEPLDGVSDLGRINRRRRKRYRIRQRNRRRGRIIGNVNPRRYRARRNKCSNVQTMGLSGLNDSDGWFDGIVSSVKKFDYKGALTTGGNLLNQFKQTKAQKQMAKAQQQQQYQIAMANARRPNIITSNPMLIPIVAGVGAIGLLMYFKMR